MKAQTSLLMKGIYLIVVFVTISIALNRVVSLNLVSTEEEKNFQQRDKATSLLETLAGSSECLAYEEEGSAEGEILELSLHRILDKKKLDDFSSRFSDIQPECARDFTSGYRIDVETFPVEISSEGFAPSTSSTTTTTAPLIPSNCNFHDECSQACNYLGWESFNPRGTFIGYGNCPYGVYGCMIRDCCIGQCNRATGDCYCARTIFVVTQYGSVCPPSYTCGSDCRCHPKEIVPKEELNVKIPPMFWKFGDLEFSKKEALQESISVSIPVVVFIDERNFIPGKMTITMVSGELEEFRGSIDKSCISGIDFQESFTFHYPVSFENTVSGYRVCLEIDGKKTCQNLACKKTIIFSGIPNSGHYTIYFRNEGNILKVVV